MSTIGSEGDALPASPAASTSTATGPPGASGGLRGELRQLVHLAVPLAVVQVGYQLAGVVDTALAGRLDDVSLAATGIGASLFFAVSVVGMGIVMGIDPLAAQAMGAEAPWRARHILWQGVYAGGLVALPLMAVIVAGTSSLDHFGVQSALAAQIRTYVYARLPSLVPLLASVAVRSYLQAAHVTRPIVLAAVATNVFNLVADWLLAFGDAGLVRIGLPPVGLPAFGVAGIAWATTVAVSAQFAVMAWAVRGLHVPQDGASWRRVSGPVIRRVMGVGLPVGLQLLAEVGVFSAVQVLMGHIGVRAAAAHQVAIMLASLSFSVCLGIGAATSVQVGRAIGRGDGPRTRRAGLLGIGLGVGFMVLSALTMLLIPQALARLLTSNRDVITAASGLIRIAAAFQIVDGIQAVSAGALRGAGVTRLPFLVNLGGHWLVGLPVGVMLAFGYGWGPAGLWWGLTCGLAVVALALASRFVQLSRRTLQPL